MKVGDSPMVSLPLKAFKLVYAWLEEWSPFPRYSTARVLDIGYESEQIAKYVTKYQYGTIYYITWSSITDFVTH